MTGPGGRSRSASESWTPVTLSRPPAPLSPIPWFHVLQGPRPLVWLVEGSQLFELEPSDVSLLASGDDAALAELRRLALGGPRTSDPQPVTEEPRAVSLALAQSCNLSCSYCYADRGRFGGSARRMPADVAVRAVDALVAGAGGRPVTLGFIGGEVLLHRRTLHEVVRYATDRAESAGVAIRFSITTNGTLATAEDIDLFREHAFTVTVSVDGGPTVNDRHRRWKGGAGSFDGALAALGALIAEPGLAKVVARATVARDDLRVHERVEALADAGFGQIGVSPLRTGPDHALRIQSQDWIPFLGEMVRAAEHEVDRLRAGAAPRFANLAAALWEIHSGSTRSLPCGSASTYVAVGADGDYWSCHRTVDNSRYRLGDVTGGLSLAARQEFLEGRGVDSQEPCRRCWARYLCGGGCHAEVDEVGREGCDYVRGWLEHCIGVYAECAAEFPSVLGAIGARA